MANERSRRSSGSFEEYRQNSRSSRSGPSRGGRGSRSGGSDGRSRGGKDRRNQGRKTEFTKVTCDACGEKCEVPFKPNSNKPIYCDKCFSKNNKSGISENDLDIINEKLNKIMKALDID